VNNHVRDSLHTQPGQSPGLVYGHALSAGVTAALSIGAAATVLALIVTLITIRVRREDLPSGVPVG
jgi:hypothetical protein